ncbi:hypothetical protein OAX09_05800 [Gammaproteobacteria bacterium]|nr:hypothetical protein [Gammaproteobacteria bacterium]
MEESRLLRHKFNSQRRACPTGSIKAGSLDATLVNRTASPQTVIIRPLDRPANAQVFG